EVVDASQHQQPRQQQNLAEQGQPVGRAGDGDDAVNEPVRHERSRGDDGADKDHADQREPPGRGGQPPPGLVVNPPAARRPGPRRESEIDEPAAPHGQAGDVHHVREEPEEPLRGRMRRCADVVDDAEAQGGHRGPHPGRPRPPGRDDGQGREQHGQDRLAGDNDAVAALGQEILHVAGQQLAPKVPGRPHRVQVSRNEEQNKPESENYPSRGRPRAGTPVGVALADEMPKDRPPQQEGQSDVMDGLNPRIRHARLSSTPRRRARRPPPSAGAARSPGPDRPRHSPAAYANTTCPQLRGGSLDSPRHMTTYGPGGKPSFSTMRISAASRPAACTPASARRSSSPRICSTSSTSRAACARRRSGSSSGSSGYTLKMLARTSTGSVNVSVTASGSTDKTASRSGTLLSKNAWAEAAAPAAKTRPRASTAARTAPAAGRSALPVTANIVSPRKKLGHESVPAARRGGRPVRAAPASRKRQRRDVADLVRVEQLVKLHVQNVAPQAHRVHA